jgi:hypothetical protein
MSGSDRPRDATERIAAIVTAEMAGAAAAATAGAGAVAASLAAFFALFPAAVGLAIWTGFEWRRWRAETWWENVWRSHWETPEEVQGLLEAHRNDAWVRETVLESVRRLLEAVADDVAPALGSLAAEYLRSRKEPDSFFRGTSRLLADLSSSEYQDLGILLEATRAFAAERLVLERKANEQSPILELRASGAGDRAAEGPREVACPRSFVRLCHQMKVHELAEDMPTGGYIAKGGPNVMVVSSTTVARLLLHIQ